MRKTGLPKQTVSDWFARRPVPDWEKFLQLIDYFDACHHSKLRELWIEAHRVTPPPATETRPQPVGRSAPGVGVPRQLPGGIRQFVGRSGELRVLDAQLDHFSRLGNGPVIISICGAAGIGKTTLAVHWARQVQDRFPDGQLYVNLRGYDPHGAPLKATDVVRGFLEALQVPSDTIPADEQAQAALLRTVVDGRRLLVVLDNARDADQVRPLLPGSPTCLLLTTSRQQLISLVAREHATHIELGPLSAGEARELLARILGEDQVSAEASAVDDIIDRCARLPLAVSIAAARAAINPALSLTALAAELGEERDRLAALSTGDSIDTNLQAVFSWSYQALSSGASRLFRLLGVHPGPDIGTPAAASLAGVPTSEASTFLTQLTRAHLLDQGTTGRFSLNDLLRAYAAQQANHADQDEIRQAVRRVLDHYVHTGHAAALLLDPARTPLDLSPACPDAAPEHLIDAEDAWAWLENEHPVMRAMSAYASRTGLHTHAWQLLWALGTFFDRRGRWHDLVTTQQAVLTAVQSLNDRPAQAFAHRGLGRAHMRLNSIPHAQHHYLQALHLYRRSGDQEGQAHTYLDLGWVSDQQQSHEKSLSYAQQALDLFEAAGHQLGQASALNSIGWECIQLGRHRQALTFCRRALALHGRLHNQRGMAETWDSLGYVNHCLGQHADAVDCYRRAIDLYRAVGERYEQAITLTRLGDSFQASDQSGNAQQSWRQALQIFDELNHPDGDKLRIKLMVRGTTS